MIQSLAPLPTRRPCDFCAGREMAGVATAGGASICVSCVSRTMRSPILREGMKVELRTSHGRLTLENITEIHYRYESAIANRIAFESDVEGTGMTMALEDIFEFEAKL